VEAVYQDLGISASESKHPRKKDNKGGLAEKQKVLGKLKVGFMIFFFLTISKCSLNAIVE